MVCALSTEQCATKIKQLSLNDTPILDTHTLADSFLPLETEHQRFLSRYIEFNLKLCSKFHLQRKKSTAPP